MKIGFVGGGNMATALIGGLLKNGWAAGCIHVADIDANARERLDRDHGVYVHEHMFPAIDGAGCVVLAVKPQHMCDVARAMTAVLGDALVITIAAGVRTTDLSRWLGGTQRIVRAMPNTPALALAGMTGLYAAANVADSDRARAEQILSTAGRTLWVESEEHMDGVTAVSGSGPAYVFYFIEALEEAALGLGFERPAARLLALETFRGAAKLASDSDESAAVLRARVTSKGGTTERALAELEKDGVREAIVRAVHAAAARSRELGEALAIDASDGRK